MGERIGIVLGVAMEREFNMRGRVEKGGSTAVRVRVVCRDEK